MKSIKMTIADVNKQSDEWKRTHYIMVYGPFDKEKPPKYFLDFQKEMAVFQKQMLDFVKEQKQFNQFVIDQFKQHGWIK